MQNRVSKRHTTPPATARLGFSRNSETSCRTEAWQLLLLWPKDLRDRTRAGRQKLIATIERELRKERRRGIAGDRAYDLARHASLVRLLRDEREALLTLTRRDLDVRALRCDRRRADALGKNCKADHGKILSA